MLFTDYCECSCHHVLGGEHVSHIMACCYKCPTCDMNIQVTAYERHAKKCAADWEALVERLKN